MKTVLYEKNKGKCKICKKNIIPSWKYCQECDDNRYATKKDKANNRSGDSGFKKAEVRSIKHCTKTRCEGSRLEQIREIANSGD